MRGADSGALRRDYLHSSLTEAYWLAVKENENYFMANLAHAMMIASLYGNDNADLKQGNTQIHENYRTVLRSIPYVKLHDTKAQEDDTDALIAEWRRLNKIDGSSASNDVKEGSDG